MDTHPWDSAANDSDYRPPRHRTLPIPASITPIANYPTKLRIFKTHASRYWQVRCFLKGRTYTQSLKTTNKQAAIHQAKHFFHIKVAELYGERLPDRGERPNTFADLVQAALAFQQGRVKRGELSAASLGILRNRLQNAILPFFGEMPLEQIGYQQVSDYIQRLSDQNLTTVTIQQHLVAIRKVLHYAVGVGKLSAVPKFPAVTVTSKPRGSYSLIEYLTLVRTARRMIGQSASRSITDKSRRGSRAVAALIKPVRMPTIVGQRNKLAKRLWEQAELAKAQQAGSTFFAPKLRTFVEQDTGLRKQIQVNKRIRPWWFTADNGKLALSVR